MKDCIIIGNRKKAPIGIFVLSIIVFVILIFFMILLMIAEPNNESFFFWIFLTILAGLAVLLCSVSLANLVKSHQNTTPLAELNDKDDYIEFYSILATKLAIKKDKIYKINAQNNGLIQIFFYNDINQKLVYNAGYFFNAKKCKEEIRKYLKQEIK